MMGPFFHRIVIKNGVKISSPWNVSACLFFSSQKHPKSVEFYCGNFPGGYLTPPVGLGLGTLEAWDGLQGFGGTCPVRAGGNTNQPQTPSTGGGGGLGTVVGMGRKNPGKLKRLEAV